VRRAPDIATLRAAAWASQAIGRLRRVLKETPVDAVRLEQPPELPAGAVRGARLAFRLRRATCLERALVLQRWHASHGSRRDVVIAVRAGERPFEAHAWLDGEPDPAASSFSELMRVPAA
jgi:Transglutaminase-like superfamily